MLDRWEAAATRASTSCFWQCRRNSQMRDPEPTESGPKHHARACSWSSLSSGHQVLLVCCSSCAGTGKESVLPFRCSVCSARITRMDGAARSWRLTQQSVIHRRARMIRRKDGGRFRWCEGRDTEMKIGMSVLMVWSHHPHKMQAVAARYTCKY